MDIGALLKGLSLDSHGFKQLLDSQSLVDCTLACSGGKIMAHKLVLSACSSYLAKILMEHPVDHPIIILPELKIEDVRTLVYYMYTGELLKSETLNWAGLLRTAAMLNVNSLNDFLNGTATNNAMTDNSSSIISESNGNIGSNINQLGANGTNLHQTNNITSPNDSSLNRYTHHLHNASSIENLSNLMASNLASGNSNLQTYFLNGSNTLLATTASNLNATNPIVNFTSGAQHPQHRSNHQQQQNNQLQATAAAAAAVAAATATANQTTCLNNVPSSNSGAAGKSEFQFKCPVCQNDFQTICSFEYHMQRVHNVTSFGCEICHKPFASLRYVLTDHMRRCHGWKAEQKLQC